ncbi:hypothetical protein K7I13_11290 [Brucepastera parasyntrophica]|uniref:hypothetical protein n=1 Tax=Brucepastera parasyntrophica TaxID=2880008 RepID=UPI00210B97D9|nr:hypothetical protein [Brucepastera parasyntrophica]ULQ59087.1 hypothetical protein K7I13_11290 [Brucepastera parasyntrophica]
MMRTSARGNNDGYVLLDAILLIFITGLTAIVVFSSISSVTKLSVRSMENAEAIILENNTRAEKRISAYDE